MGLKRIVCVGHADRCDDRISQANAQHIIDVRTDSFQVKLQARRVGRNKQMIVRTTGAGTVQLQVVIAVVLLSDDTTARATVMRPAGDQIVTRQWN